MARMSSKPTVWYIFLLGLGVAEVSYLLASLLLVAMLFVPSSLLLLVARTGAPSSVLAPTSNGLQPKSPPGQLV